MQDTTPQDVNDAFRRHLNELRRRGQFCDVTVVSGSTELQCHRVILAASSSYFATMLSSNDWAESQEGRIMLPSHPEHLVSAAIEHIYTHQCQFDAADACDMLHLAVHLDLPALAHQCEALLHDYIDDRNALNITTIAEAFDLQTLLQRTWQYINRNFRAVILSPSFSECDLHAVVAVMQRPVTVAMWEVDRLHAILSWIQHDPDARLQHFLRLLELVEFGLIRQPQLQEVLNMPVCGLELPGVSRAPSRSSSQRLAMSPLPPMDERSRMGRSRLTSTSSADSLIALASTPPSTVLGVTHAASCRVGDILLTHFASQQLDGVSILDQMPCKGALDQDKPSDMTTTMSPDDSQDQECDDVTSPRADLRGSQPVNSRMGLFGVPIVVGGFCTQTGRSNEVAIFDRARQAWRPLPRLQCARSYSVCIALGNSLYCMGGFAGPSTMQRHADDQRVQDTVGALATVERFDTTLGEWKPAMPMLSPRACFGVGVIGSIAYIIGGYGRLRQDATSNILSACEALDLNPDRPSLRRLPGLPSARAEAAVAADQHCVYVCGGHVRSDASSFVDDDDLVPTSSVLRFDVLQGTWQQMPELPVPLARACACVVGGTLYVAGGTMDAGGRVLSSLFGLNLQEREWRTLPPMAMPRRCAAMTPVMNQAFVVAGGYNGHEITNACELFDCQLQRWHKMPSLYMAVRGASATAFVE